MATLPATPRGTAKVMPGRGVKINYLLLVCQLPGSGGGNSAGSDPL